jgi:hypothetical protein
MGGKTRRSAAAAVDTSRGGLSVGDCPELLVLVPQRLATRWQFALFSPFIGLLQFMRLMDARHGAKGKWQ